MSLVVRHPREPNKKLLAAVPQTNPWGLSPEDLAVLQLRKLQRLNQYEVAFLLYGRKSAQTRVSKIELHSIRRVRSMGPEAFAECNDPLIVEIGNRVLAPDEPRAVSKNIIQAPQNKTPLPDKTSQGSKAPYELNSRMFVHGHHIYDWKKLGFGRFEFSLGWFYYVKNLPIEEVVRELYTSESDPEAARFHAQANLEKIKQRVVEDQPTVSEKSCLRAHILIREILRTTHSTESGQSENQGGETNDSNPYLASNLKEPPKACPRCKGKILYQKDFHGAYGSCMSCGFVYEFDAIASRALEVVMNDRRQRRTPPSHRSLQLF